MDFYLAMQKKTATFKNAMNERKQQKKTHTHKQAAQKWQCRLNKLHCEWGMGHAFALTV